MTQAQKYAINKNPKFVPNHYETWSKWVTHELVMEVKFRNDWEKIVDFLNKKHIFRFVKIFTEQSLADRILNYIEK